MNNRFPRRTQPQAFIGKYNVCKNCYRFYKKDKFIFKLNMCQKCSIKKNLSEYYFYLSRLSKPGIDAIYRRILLDYF